MRDWKVKLVQVHKRHAELEISAHTEQEAIEIAESIVEEEPEVHWSDSELDDQYVEQMAEL
jgi:non-homologous end joining protein Ku